MKATVKEVMSTEVVAVRRGASYKEMAASLRQYRVSAFPVVDDDGKVIGVVSEADLLAREALADGQVPSAITGLLHHQQHVKADALTAGDLMTHPAVTVRPGDTVEHAARMMYTLQVKRLPVVDAGGYLIGIVSRSDLLAVFDRSDKDILKEITDDIMLNEFLSDPQAMHVTVENGVVTLSGVPETRSVGQEIVQQARHAWGVVAVRDRLDYPPAEPPGGDFDVLARFSVD